MVAETGWAPDDPPVAEQRRCHARIRRSWRRELSIDAYPGEPSRRRRQFCREGWDDGGPHPAQATVGQTVTTTTLQRMPGDLASLVSAVSRVSLRASASAI